MNWENKVYFLVKVLSVEEKRKLLNNRLSYNIKAFATFIACSAPFPVIKDVPKSGDMYRNQMTEYECMYAYVCLYTYIHTYDSKY